jgi:hypothetical protein
MHATLTLLSLIQLLRELLKSYCGICSTKLRNFYTVFLLMPGFILASQVSGTILMVLMLVIAVLVVVIILCLS